MHPDARPFLVEALTERLDQVRAAPAGRPQDVQASDEAGSTAAADPEETLRVVMVKLWPRVRSGTATAAQRAQLFDHLRSLAPVACGRDLRFLDAMNNAYETLEEAGFGTDSGPFLAAYRDVLEAQRERLTR